MKRFAIIASEYNSVIMDGLIAGAQKALRDADVMLIRVPGSFELAIAAKKAASSKRFDGVVALGCILRGETPHFDYISAAVSNGLQQVALESGVPIGFGVLTVDTVQQAIERSGESANKGFEAAAAAASMVNVLKTI